MKWTYLLINFFTVIIPFAGSFGPRFRFYQKWKYYFPAMLFTAAFFLVFDHYKTRLGVWGFNDKYIIGLKFFGLPAEEILFFITVPYACTMIYEAVSYAVKKLVFGRYTSSFLYLVSLLFLISSYWAYPRIYTTWVCVVLGVVLPFAVYILRESRLDKFVLMYLISLIPMAIVDGILTGLPVVIYNNAENLGIRIGSIPIEDFGYSAILLLMNISLYEWLKSGAERKIVS